MKCTLDLLNMALSTSKSESALSKDLKLSRNTLGNTRRTGKLSPLVAGAVAEHLNQPIAEWMALAAIENDPRITPSKGVRSLAARVRNSYFVSLIKRVRAGRNAPFRRPGT